MKSPHKLIEQEASLMSQHLKHETWLYEKIVLTHNNKLNCDHIHKNDNKLNDRKKTMIKIID